MKKEIYNYLNQYKDLYDNELILSNNLKFVKEELIQKNNLINKCSECSSVKKNINFIYRVGNPKADILFIGKALDKKQDLSQIPSINQSGKLFEKILLAVNLKRDDVYIINILNNYPHDNSTSITKEIEICNFCLKKELKILNPKLVVCLGQLAAMILLETNENLTDLRDEIHNYDGIDFLVTYHPEDLLNNPKFKKLAWKDFKFIRDNYLNGTN